MKTHFSDDEYAEEGICNTYSEKISSCWHEVTCKKCLKLRGKYEALVAISEKDAVNQMGDYVDFYQKNKLTGERNG